MVDIHSHILPGLDDGADTIEEAVAMIRMAAEDGTTDIVATPHANNEYNFQPGLIASKIEELHQAVGGAIRIHPGCDFHLSYDNIQDALASPSKYAINHKRYVLVEFSDLLIPKTTDDVFYRMLRAGILPIITHPERNALILTRMEKLEAWIENGCLVQVTALSLLGRFGKRAKAFSDQLLDRNLVHFVASDAHDTKYRPPTLRASYEYVAKRSGEERAEALFVANPRAALAGDAIEVGEVVDAAKSKKWYRFW